MAHLSRRPKALLTALQGMTVLVMIGGTYLAFILGLFGVTGLSFASKGIQGTLFIGGALLTLIVVSLCCYMALGRFIALLQRMKRETAFTSRNCEALGAMTRCCAVAAAALFAMASYWMLMMVVEVFSHAHVHLITEILSLMDVVLFFLAWPFGFGVVALLIQGVRLLMERAMKLQCEQELVV